MGNFQSADDLEHKQLLAQIGNIERNMALPASREVSSALLTYLNSLKTRLSNLEDMQKASEEAKERTESLQRVAMMVERETALNAVEKEQYGGFLQKEYFTKADFGSLEKFYSHTWNKLSEGGKYEMSHRVWEGVRRGEFKFQEMPEPIMEKEAQRVRGELEAGHKNLQAIPENDRRDFINSWDAGRKHESYKVLDRPSFSKSVSVSDGVAPDKAAVDKVSGKSEVVVNEKNEPKPTASSQSVQAKSRLQNLAVGELSEVSLMSGEVKPPLDGHKKSDSTPTRG